MSRRTLMAVTGAGGHIGTNLVRELVARGVDVRATDATEPRSLLPSGVTWVTADVRDAAAMRAVFDGADVVYHLAAVISVVGGMRGVVHDVNVNGVRCVAEAALAVGVRRMVHCSSVHAYDLRRATGSVLHEGSPRAGDPHLPAYDRSKAAGEAQLRAVIARGLDAVVVNPTAVIGPADDSPSRMGAVLQAVWRRRLRAVVGGGFDWVDVRDVVAAVIAAGERGRCGENYLVPGHRLSARELVDAACAVAQIRPPAMTVPMWLARLGSPLSTVRARPTGDPLRFTVDTLHALAAFPIVSGAKAALELGHRARPYAATLGDLHRYFCAGTSRPL